MGFSSDGDNRLLGCMKSKTPLIAEPSVNIDSLFDNQQSVFYIQDSIHVGTKSRNRILKPCIVLPMGNKIVSVSHLKILINQVPKDEHRLVMSDICPDDRQNFGSLEKIMQPCVYTALQKYVIGSEATVMYFQIFSEAISAFTENDLSPTDRIYRIWHCVYFLRAWKVWLLQSSMLNSLLMLLCMSNITMYLASCFALILSYLPAQDKYNTLENFVSSNLYSCVELNAHNLVSLMIYLRNQNKPELFVPLKLNSQPCEESFRQMRSMGTINYTKINFTLLELFHLVGRIELQNDIVFSKLADREIAFPRNKKFNISQCKFQLQSDDEIKLFMLKAKEDAIKDAQQLGMIVGIDEISMPQLKGTISKLGATSDTMDEVNGDADVENDENEENELAEPSQKSMLDCSNLKNYSLEATTTSNSGQFVTVLNSNGTPKVVRVSTLIWLLTDSRKGLSNDRLNRVQGAGTRKSCSRQLQFKRKQPPQIASKNCEIQIGEWCVFNNDDQSRCRSEFLLGTVLGFQYIDENSSNGISKKKSKEKPYTWDFAPIAPPMENDRQRGINVLALWYACDVNGNIERIPFSSSFYTNIDNYIATLSNTLFQPPTSGEDLLFTKTFANNLREQLLILKCKRSK